MLKKQRILTTPKEEEPNLKYFLTGNEYVSLANITPQLELKNLSVILQKEKCLLEFAEDNSPLISPVIEINNKQPDFNFKIDYLENWIVNATSEKEKLQVEINIFAPPEFKGFVYYFKLKNLSTETQSVFVGLQGALSKILQTIFYSQPIFAKLRAFCHQFMKNLIFELRDSTVITALSVWSDEINVLNFAKEKITAKEFNIENNLVIDANFAEKINYLIGSNFNLQPNEEKTLSFYFALNNDADGAGGCNVDMQRWGGEKLLQKTTNYLKDKTIKVADKKISKLLNRNLFFSLYYSIGRALDTDELILLTSRSSFYYVSCAFWARDSLLWSFPAILLIDKKLARRIILQVFKIYSKNAGEHALYIDGNILYPGFELDELCAYVIALDNYLEATLDYSILEEDNILKTVKELEKKLFSKLNINLNLFETFLLSSDDPAPYPYITFSNVLAYKTLLILGHLYEHLYDINKKEKLFKIAKKVRAAIFEKCTVQIKDKTMFVFCTDGKGNYILGDEPVGSLVLLPYYNFCEKINDVYENTVNFIYSAENKYFYEGEKITGTGCEHSLYPSPFTLANNLLSAVNFNWQNNFLECEMDNGFACETVDKDTGIVKTGRAFATLAGFLAYALHEGYGIEKI